MTKLKAGLEIHQQLETHKLFCHCPSILRSDEPQFTIERKLNPVVGETGKVDTAALYEQQKDRTFEYLVHDTNCLVELDEEPPHAINQHSLRVALQIALLFNCKIFPEAQIMRKTVINGSNTGGFQRTVLIAYDGYIETSEGKVRIETIALEEDSARPAGTKDGKTLYNLDRLGIPLVEITTKPDLKSPEQIKEAALKIGEILRACEVKRGLGTIRQDVNISIEGGERVERKGFQDAKTMIHTVETEVLRQENLAKLKDKFKKANIDTKVTDVSKVFDKTECKFVKKALMPQRFRGTPSGAKKEGVFGFKIEKLAGTIGFEIQPNKRIGTDFSDYAKPVSGIGGIIHSDEELSKYSFTQEEIDAIKDELGIKKADAFILIVGTKDQAKKARTAIEKRIKLLTNGTPQEVRKSEADGTTTFLRPMPGAARMYPETDCELLRIKKPFVDELKSDLPKLVSENKAYLKEYGLTDESIMLLLKQGKLEDFKVLAKVTDHYALIGKTLTLLPINLANKEGKSVEDIEEIMNNDLLAEVFEKVPEEIAPVDVKNVLLKIVQGKTLEQALEKSTIDLALEVKSIMKEKPGLREGAYMGLLMKKLAGQVSGKEISDELKRIVGSE